MKIHIKSNKETLGAVIMLINWTHSDVRSTLDNEAMGETVKANGATLLIQVDLFFRKEMGDSAAGTKTRTHRKPGLITEQPCISYGMK